MYAQSATWAWPPDGVLDLLPGVLGDRRDGVSDAFRAAADRHRVAHVQAVQRDDRVVRPEPRIEPDRQRTGRAGATDAGDQLFEETDRAALGVRRSLPHPRVQHLSGVSACGQQRVIAEGVGVAEPGTLLRVAVDFTDRRVDVDHQRPRVWAGAHRPGAFEGVADHGFHLPAVPERERTQERPDRRRCHHPMPQHTGGASGAEHVRVIDVRRVHAHRVRQCQHFAAWAGTADTAIQSHCRIDQALQVEALRQRRDEQQPGVRDEVRVIEGRVDPVKRVRYSRH